MVLMTALSLHYTTLLYWNLPLQPLLICVLQERTLNINSLHALYMHRSLAGI